MTLNDDNNIKNDTYEFAFNKNTTNYQGAGSFFNVQDSSVQDEIHIEDED